MTSGSRRSGRARLAVALVSAVSLACMLAAPPAYAADSVASVGDVTVSESGATAVFTVTLSESNGTTTVTYSTSNNTAIAGTDYTATSGTLTFGPGETSKTVSVPILGDALDEPDETFFFTLRSIQNGVFTGGDPNAIGTIVDDDAAPQISITDASVTEGNSGTATTTVNVSLSAASGRHVTVDFTTADGTATFSPGGDYHSQSGRLVFIPGDTVETITLTVVSDTTDETDETFFVNLSDPQFASIADPQSAITILDDDAATQPPPAGSPTISISDTTLTEGNSGTVQGTVTVTLSRASSQFVGVDFATQDNTATFSGADYHSQSGRLVFAPGETSKTITVTVVGDATDEPNETFFLNLSGATNATISDNRAVITIVDDDSETTTPPPPSGSVPSISIGDVSAAEGDEDETRLSVTVSLSAATSDYVSVDFQTSDGTALFSDADYWSTSGRLVFVPGDTSETITVTVVGDLRDEANEVFYLDLFNPTRATISDGRGAVTILDDDGSSTPPPGGTIPAVSVSDASAQEGDSETTTATITVSLSAATDEYVTVDVTTTNGTATFRDGDFWALSGRLVFEPGVTSQPLQVTINGDTITEGDEIFYLDVIGTSTNATVADPRSVITIRDDEERTAVGPARGPCANRGFDTRAPIPDGDGEIIVGTKGDDVLIGTDGDDIICGLGGNDVIDALAGQDQVVGNAGDDDIDGGAGKDKLNGNKNGDTVSGRGGTDVIVGANGHDTLKGNRGIDTIRGEDGNDTLQGGSYQDTLIGGTGRDTIRGWTGADVLRGGGGHDILNGHAGFDICRGGRGNNVVRNCER